MTELEFIKHWCGDLTEPQLHMAKYFIDNGYFIGVGRAVGRSVYWPLISRDGKRVEVVDTAGYQQLSSIDGRIGYA